MGHEPHGDDAPPAAGVGHETRDISTRVVVIFASLLVAGAIVVHLAVWGLYLVYGRVNASAYPRQYPLASSGPAQLPPEPRLQTQPREDLKALRRDEDTRLRSYGWVDPQRGVVHIPIDRAMQALLEQGLPARADARGAGEGR